MAMIGGIFALFVTGTPFSISAAIGFIALFGISTMEGVILLAYYNQLLEEGWERSEAIWNAAVVRMRPVMMTCVAACVGLLPAAISTGIGSQVQKPLALVVVGGIILAPTLILVVVPILISLFSPAEDQPRGAGAARTPDGGMSLPPTDPAVAHRTQARRALCAQQLRALTPVPPAGLLRRGRRVLPATAGV